MWSQLNKAFKGLLGIRHTSDAKTYYEEVFDDTLDLHSDSIKAEAISFDDPATAITNNVAVGYTLFVLTKDISVANDQCWYAYSAPDRLKQWITPKYGPSYRIRLYDNLGNEIFPTDVSDWFFDYNTGVLTFNGNLSAYQKPFKISGYRYIGKHVTELLGGGGPSTNQYIEETFIGVTSYTVLHGWNKKPMVEVVDADGNSVNFTLTYDNNNQVTVYFNEVETGSIIVQGSFGSPTNPGYSLIQDGGSSLPNRSTLNFLMPNVGLISDVGGKTVINLSNLSGSSIIFDSIIDIGNVIDSEQTLLNYDLPANKLGFNKEKLTGEYNLILSGSAATKRLRFYFGGFIVFDTGAITMSGLGAITIAFTIYRVSSTSVKYRASATLKNGTGILEAVGQLTTVDLTIDNQVFITSEIGAGSAGSNEVILSSAYIEWKKASA